MPLIAILALLLLAPLAFADAADDYRAVHHDWEKDGQITPCYWTETQLRNAREIANDNPDDTYNGFPEKVDAEIARWRRGDCRPRPRIVGVAAKRERIKIANRGLRPAKVGGMRVRDRQGNGFRIRSGTVIPVGESIVLRTPRDRRIWDDAGDVARLVRRSGTVVSRYGYGRYRNVKRF